MKFPSPVEVLLKTAKGAAEYIDAQREELDKVTEQMLTIVRKTDPGLADRFVALNEQAQVDLDALTQVHKLMQGETVEE